MIKKILFPILFFLTLTSLFTQTIYDYVALAEESMLYQKYYEAVENYKEALSINPADINSNKGLSDAFFMLGEYQEAIIYIDKCIELNINNIEFLNSKARILTAIGDYNKAKELYDRVLDREIYNIRAKSGLAELRIAEGDIVGSLYDFEKILKFSPNSRRLLLSLVVLYDSQGKYENSNELIQQAIRVYPEDPIVLEAAVNHYINTKSYKGASLYMSELLNVSKSSSIRLLNAKLLIYLEEFEKALDELTQYMKIEKKNPEAYYLAALILDELNQDEKALSLIKRGIDLKPDDEIFRFYSEKLMGDMYILKDSKRDLYSNWYLNQGLLLEDRYFYEKAKVYYQRGVELSPFNSRLRYTYGNILKKMGYRQSYLKELNFLLSSESDLTEIDDDIDEIILIEDSLPKKPLYEKWGEERWNFDDYFKVSTFINNSTGEGHLSSGKIIKDITNRFLSGQSKYFVSDISLFSGNLSSAFNKSRQSNSDYFLIINFLEGSRTFSLNARLHLTKSGREIKSFNYLKTGNNRIFNCFENLSKDLNDFLPTIGSVIDIKGESVLLNIGLNQKVQLDTEFHVVKKGSFFIIPDPPFLDFDLDKHLGVVKIEAVGEGMSDGSFTANNSFNLLNIGDNILYLPVDQGEKVIDESFKESIMDSELIGQLLKVN